MATERAAPLLFIAAALAFLARFWSLRYVGLNLDECSYIVQGWSVALGGRLYEGGIWHHMPFGVLLAHPMAALGLVGDPAPYRFLVILAQVAAAGALLASPAFHGRRLWGYWAGAGYLLLQAVLAPALDGHIYSGYALAGAAWVIGFAALLLPLMQASRLPFWAALVGGGALTVWALSSPALFLAAGFTVLALAFAPGMRLRQWQAVLGAGALVVLLQGAWTARFGGLGDAWRQAILFNLHVYPMLNREPGAASLPWAILSDAWQALRGLGSPALLLLGLPLALASAWRWASARQRAFLLCLLLAFLATRIRLYQWKGMPYHAASYAGAVALLVGSGAGFRLVRWAYAGLLAVVLSSAALQQWDRPAEGGYWHAAPSQAQSEALAQLRQRLPQGSRMIALHQSPHLYMLAGLAPGHRGAGYGPIGVLLDAPEGGPARHLNLCRQIAEGKPAVIYEKKDFSLYHLWVAQMVPPCVDALKARDYTPLPAWPQWWVRKELLPRVEGLPPAPLVWQ